jgi:ubiquinone/menaquinone biosynthesis C-methylase UbiE
MTFDRNLKTTFQKGGKNYQASRREYPKQIIDWIVKEVELNKSSKILDIGCGTGKSTLPFAKLGYTIKGIDRSENMIGEAKKASRKYKNASYRIGSFENMKISDNSFDVVLAGTAFHWLNPEIRCKKIHSVLKKDGHLVIFWSAWANDQSDFLKRMRELYVQNAPNYPQDYGNSEKKFLPELEASKLFEKPHFKVILEQEKYTKEKMLNLINSYSWVMSLDKNQKRKLFEDLENLFKEYKEPLIAPAYFKVIIAKRASN